MRAAAVIALAGLLVAAPVAATAAVSDHLAVSQDGRTWSSSLHGSVLQDAPERWAPGDHASGAFWVRNDGPTAASLSVALEPGTSSSALLDDLSFRATVGGRTLDLASSDEPGTSLAVLDHGATTKVSLAVAFDPESQNPSQSETEPIRIRVRLTDTAAQVAGPQVTPAQSQASGSLAEGSLPATGSSLEPWLTWAAVVLIGVGSVLTAGVARRRRRRP